MEEGESVHTLLIDSWVKEIEKIIYEHRVPLSRATTCSVFVGGSGERGSGVDSPPPRGPTPLPLRGIHALLCLEVAVTVARFS